MSTRRRRLSRTERWWAAAMLLCAGTLVWLGVSGATLSGGGGLALVGLLSLLAARLLLLVSPGRLDRRRERYLERTKPNSL